MSSRDPAGYGEGHSKKGRLSFLLNHDDVDNRPQGSHNHFGADGDVPMVSERVRGSGSSSSKRGSYRSSGRGLGSTSLPMPSIGAERATHFERSQPSRISSANDTVGSEKRGVRKKRQRKFICDRCNFGFYTNSDLQKHVSSVHLLLRPYECSMCDKKFGERSNATKHFKSVHERQKNAACDQCHKVFAFRDGLVRHVRLVHENVRNFHCQYPGCGQSFKQSAHLKKHEQIHTKARPGSRFDHNFDGERSGPSPPSHH